MSAEKMSEQFQREARQLAHHAALRLREAATKLEKSFTGEPLAQDGMDVVSDLGVAVWSAQSCIAHAMHRHALSVLHCERERAEGKQ
ncbi:hypothetical protein [Microbacterium galbinum]|uniref:Uncharacterized protein n=1 Tax=Microbacterium galbinum TaxID=2851646 RepID=A0ABY4IJW9_9MICO|nr:hypothetical protein [Microbacterium galbinum]UPL13038.1 hypothetical protein KV396_00375 [Microbacterium galbinum]